MMVDWPATIIGEIRDRHATRAQIAHTYSLCLHRIDFPWGRVNAEILARYRPSGLDWIKRAAWRRLKERVRGGGAMNNLRAEEIRLARELFGLEDKEIAGLPYTVRELAPRYSRQIDLAHQVAAKLRDCGWLVVLKWMPEGHPFLGDEETGRLFHVAAACQLSWMGRAQGAGERHLIWRQPWALADTMPQALVKAAVLALDAMQKAGVPVTRPDDEMPGLPPLLSASGGGELRTD